MKKQKSKEKKAPTAYEALLSQPPPRIPMELGYLDLDGLLIENPRIGDTTDAELFVQNQMDRIISAKRDHKPSTILVNELSKTITLSQDADGYAHVMGKPPLGLHRRGRLTASLHQKLVCSTEACGFVSQHIRISSEATDAAST